MASAIVSISPDFVFVDWASGALRGPAVRERVTKLGDLRGLFHDHESWRALDPATVVYRVQSWQPVSAGTQGGLFWGSTVIEPGRVGEEYFMTYGHRHAMRDRAEFYGTMCGRGMLILIDESGHARTEPMSPGSLHYIPGGVAHRVANIGDSPLRFVACWPSDAGHDYGGTRKSGFGARLICRNGVPVLETKV